MADWERSEGAEDWPGCRGCVHYNRMRCVAYPDRIPLIIASGEVDHLVPRPGQVGETVFASLDLQHWLKTKQHWLKTKERRVLAKEAEPAARP
jgi:hypothetical protein